MNNENCDLLVDYLNGTLSEQETREFEEHLKTCGECREIIDATGELPYLADPVEPPAEMKSRILANVFEEQQAAPAPAAKQAVAPRKKRTAKRSWWTPLIAAVLLLSLLGNAYALMMLSDREEEPEIQTAFQSVDLQSGEAFGGSATAAIIKEENSLDLVVQADQLEELEGSEVYQVWLLKEGQPIPAGSFTPNENGEGAAHYSLEENTEEWDTIAITKEPEAGNELPEGEIVLSSEI